MPVHEPAGRLSATPGLVAARTGRGEWSTRLNKDRTAHENTFDALMEAAVDAIIIIDGSGDAIPQVAVRLSIGGIDAATQTFDNETTSFEVTFRITLIMDRLTVQ